jgi:hypothetical protein
MTSTSTSNPDFPGKNHPLPENSILIIGSGYFGERAARILSTKPELSLVLVDQDQNQLEKITHPVLTKVVCDGVNFLSDHFASLNPSFIIIPAVPLHLAFLWLQKYIQANYNEAIVKGLDVPGAIKNQLPHTWDGLDGSLLISYADFLCPDNCPEPADHCTVTGEKRPKPLYGLLAELDLPGFQSAIIKSRQLAPGIGGYLVADLKELFEKITKRAEGTWLIGTACRCHGVLSAMHIQL